MPLHSRPGAAAVPLRLAPVLESWNASGHDDQVRLRASLGEVVPLVDVAGVLNPRRPFRPVDDTLGDAVVIGYWWPGRPPGGGGGLCGG
ncbi:hypothetical protein [Dactylosporangium sp. NPDC049140]|uniref:hypothetical protein n=1 Tax=Dactylosporangium sp. NPDC049140 TaxID=3155647 RepID=UPI0033E5F747